MIALEAYIGPSFARLVLAKPLKAIAIVILNSDVIIYYARALGACSRSQDEKHFIDLGAIKAIAIECVCCVCVSCVCVHVCVCVFEWGEVIMALSMTEPTYL